MRRAQRRRVAQVKRLAMWAKSRGLRVEGRRGCYTITRPMAIIIDGAYVGQWDGDGPVPAEMRGWPVRVKRAWNGVPMLMSFGGRWEGGRR